MTKIWRKQEWERQVEENPDECIRISPNFVFNKSKQIKDDKKRRKSTTKNNPS